ncbi:SAM-dependent methyltransferase [Kibdelosporangium philippinense]|uniref:S-adenosyl-L-methionine-dependent methyltransferase n=1 Tax=Kibdelosporangium philippinense TaxID=211113 RepID=A0ABS8Z2T4_9PSEU|nr:SAM-dependent methyltransferase [Kibdelosporangium philippinense]MCE7002251.1 SAM-dependent methyltransferase [Kibdelosporangium philippinense]
MGALTLPTGIGYTAMIAAYARAQEAKQDNPLFVDPLADLFVAAATGLVPGTNLPRLGPIRIDDESLLWDFLSALFCGRTPFFDAHIKQHVGAGIRQIVILAAGLDTRAFRMNLPATTTVYEIDTPEVLDFKAAVLADEQPTATRVAVPADLREDWAGALTAAGFRPNVRTLWLVEGLLMYFDAAAADNLLATISSLSLPANGLLTETIIRKPVMQDVPEIVGSEDEAVTRLFMEAFRTPPYRNVGDWMSSQRWRCDEAVTLAEQLTRVNRPIPEIVRRCAADPFGTVLASSVKLQD